MGSHTSVYIIYDVQTCGGAFAHACIIFRGALQPLDSFSLFRLLSRIGRVQRVIRLMFEGFAAAIDDLKLVRMGLLGCRFKPATSE